ncbi:hypothetical protein ACTZWW_09430 [Salinarimonas sp. NSM]|uniref:hypothetical protein n=1 Tax=Salinarimonas sp. NSM TaxID=3458003 RepID=UPI004036B393
MAAKKHANEPLCGNGSPDDEPATGRLATAADATEKPPTPDMVPHASSERMTGDHAPVDDARPNPAMLKADVDSGRTGDKNAVFHPGMSMLGTDDEVAGNPASPERVRFAREEAARNAPKEGAPAPADIARTGGGRVVGGFVALIVVVGVVAVTALLMA